MLSITNNLITYQSFVYTWLNDRAVLFQAIQFSKCYLFALRLNVKQFYSTHSEDPITCYNTGPELTRVRWRGRGTPHFPKLQLYWCLTIRLFWVISRPLVQGFLTPCIDAIAVFYSPCQLGHRTHLGEVLPLCRDTLPAEWAKRHLLWESYFPAEMQLVYSTVSANWTTEHSLQGSISLLHRSSWCLLHPLQARWATKMRIIILNHVSNVNNKTTFIWKVNRTHFFMSVHLLICQILRSHVKGSF